MMIFLCFNINDRELIAEPLLQHLRSFGFFVWYDRKDIYIGDSRYYENITNGAGNNELTYAVVILTNNFEKGNFCKEELEIIKQRYDQRNMSVFPIIYDFTDEEAINKYKWIFDLVCKYIYNKNEAIYACYHIVAKITHDLLKNEKYQSLYDFIHSDSDTFLKKSILCYDNIDKNNYNAQITALYFIYLYIAEHNEISILPPFYYKGFEKIFSFTKLNITTDKREVQILENILTLLLSKFY